MGKTKRLCILILCAVMVFLSVGTVSASAVALEPDRLTTAFRNTVALVLSERPEIKYLELMDINGDGNEEAVAAREKEEGGFFEIEVWAVNDDGVSIKAYRLNSDGTPISYDPWNRVLVCKEIINNVENFKLYTLEGSNWTTLGIRSEDKNGNHSYYMTSLEVPMTLGLVPGAETVDIEILSEEQFKEYFRYFSSLEPIELSRVPAISTGEEVYPGDMIENGNEEQINTSLSNEFELRYQELDAGGRQTVRIVEGNVISIGDNEEGQRNTQSWTDVVKVCAGIYSTVGLRADGTVYATGRNWEGQCDTGDWTDIIDVDTQHFHTVGLKSDGTLVATGFNAHGECEIGKWENIVQAQCGEYVTIGLKEDGTVIATGDNLWGQCNVEDWKNIVAIDAGYHHVVGLMENGRAVAAGRNQYGQCNVSAWSDVVQISAGTEHTVALLADGTVVATGHNNYGQCNVSDWTDMVLVCAGHLHTVGLRADGTVLATGWNQYGQCNVGRLNY